MENKSTEDVKDSFCHKFSLKTDASREFEIKPLQKEHLELVIDLTCKVFAEREPLGVFLGATAESWRPSIRGVAERSIEENMGVICVESKTGNIAVIVMCYDVYNEQLKPVYPASEDLPQQQIDEVLLKVEEGDFIEVTKPFDAIELFTLVSIDGYQGLGLAKETVNWLIHSHPIVTKVKAVGSAVTNPATKAIMEKAGAKTVKTINLLEYKNDAGEAVFSGITEAIEKKLKIPDYKEVAYCVYVRK